MQFIKDYLRNLLILIFLGVIIYFMFPDMMSQIFELYGLLFGPLAVVIVLVVALPRRSRKKEEANKRR